MNPGRMATPVIAAALLVVGSIAAACGGGGALTLEEYFREIEAFSGKYDEATNALEAEFDEAADSEEEEQQIQAIRDLFGGGVPLLRAFVDDLRGLNPPGEVEAAHDASVEAGTEATEVFQDVVDRLNEADSPSEVEEALGDPGLATAGDRFDQTCRDLQAIADENGIDVDLDCEEAEE